MTNQDNLPLSFTTLKSEHKALVVAWLNKPHVRPYFFGQGLKNTLENLDLYVNGHRHNGHYFFDLWIAENKGYPFGLLMSSPIEEGEPWYITGEKTMTLDLLIGEESFLGRGLAPGMIRQFLLTHYEDVSIVLIDPAVRNTKAIHVYKKTGFKKIEQVEKEELCWMMKLEMKDLLDG